MIKKLGQFFNLLVSIYVESFFKYASPSSTDKIELLVFSFDRPLQLKLFIQSIEKNTDFKKISVILRTSNKKILEQYYSLIRTSEIVINYHIQGSDLKSTLTQYLQTCKATFLFLCVDDQVCLSPVTVEEIREAGSHVDTLTLRFGANTRYSYNLGIKLDLASCEPSYINNMISWDAQNAHGDLAYVNSFDGTLLPRLKFERYSKYGIYIGPNSLEGIMNYGFQKFLKKKHIVGCMLNQKFVNIVFGQVQNETQNKSEHVHVDFLLKKFEMEDFLSLTDIESKTATISSPHESYKKVFQL